VEQNSFGYGGANAHAILDSVQSYLGDRYQSIPRPMESEPQLPKRYYLLPFSAHNETTLKRNIEAFSSGALGDTHLPSLAYTLGSCRSNHSERAFTVVASNPTGIQLSS
jgi:acyl transferase domain-containing protein